MGTLGRLQKLLNQRRKRKLAWELGVFFIRGGACFPKVSTAERTTSASCWPARATICGEENVFQFVCIFTGSKKPASGGTLP